MNDPVIAEYSRIAANYDQRWAAYTDATVRETLARIRPGPGERLVDVGCGTGMLLAGIARQQPDACLVGLDPVAEMLAVARQRLPRDVRLQVARAQNLPLADAGFDHVVSSSAFHFIPDPHRALAEMHRILVPGGRLVISDWCADYFTMRLLDWRLRLFDAAHYRTWKGSELAAALRDVGFVDIHVERYKIDWQWGLMCVTATRTDDKHSNA